MKKDKVDQQKDRNWVAKNASSTTKSAAGFHKDQKRAAKNGDIKHKNKDYVEHLEKLLAEKLVEGLSAQDKKDVDAIKSAIKRLQNELNDPNPNVDKENIKQRIATEKKRLGLYGQSVDEGWKGIAGAAAGAALGVASMYASNPITIGDITYQSSKSGPISSLERETAHVVTYNGNKYLVWKGSGAKPYNRVWKYKEIDQLNNEEGTVEGWKDVAKGAGRGLAAAAIIGGASGIGSHFDKTHPGQQFNASNTRYTISHNPQDAQGRDAQKTILNGKPYLVWHWKGQDFAYALPEKNAYQESLEQKLKNEIKKYQ